MLDYRRVSENGRPPGAPDGDDEVLLTTEEVTAILNVNLRTLYRLLKHKQIPVLRVGRQWRFRRGEIDVWLRQRRPPGERKRILVVDDEMSVRDMVAKALTQARYNVDTAVDGASAIDRLHGTSYDLLITDLKMPGMDGLAVIREARRLDAALAIVIITGASTEASAIEACNLGVHGYLTKPFGFHRIVSVAARAMGVPGPTQPGVE